MPTLRRPSAVLLPDSARSPRPVRTLMTPWTEADMWAVLGRSPVALERSLLVLFALPEGELLNPVLRGYAQKILAQDAALAAGICCEGERLSDAGRQIVHTGLFPWIPRLVQIANDRLEATIDLYRESLIPTGEPTPCYEVPE